MADLDSSPMSWGDVDLNDNINTIISSLDCEDTAKDEEEEVPATQLVDQRVLKNVVAFVDVRTGADNRSAAVALQLEKLGAQVEKKLTKAVTHVVFKDGRRTTLDIALKRKLRLVTVLWVDSCRVNQEHVSEGLFPVAAHGENLTPMFGRLKKMKSMQPKDFDEELKGSAERAKRTMKRRENKMKKLAWKNLFTENSQPDEEQIPVISTAIPATPPFMVAKIEQLRREREEREAMAKSMGMDSIDESDYSETDLRLSLDPSPDVEYNINLSVGNSPHTQPHSSPEDIFSQNECHKEGTLTPSPVHQDSLAEASKSSSEGEASKEPAKKRRKLFSSQEVGDPSSFLITPKRTNNADANVKNHTGNQDDTPGTNVSAFELGRQVLISTGLNEDDDTPVVASTKGKGQKRKRTVSQKTLSNQSDMPVKKDRRKSAKVTVDENTEGNELKTKGISSERQRSVGQDNVQVGGRDKTKENRRRSALSTKKDETELNSLQKTGEGIIKQNVRGRRKSARLEPKERVETALPENEKLPSLETVPDISGKGGQNSLQLTCEIENGNEKRQRGRRKSSILTEKDKTEVNSVGTEECQGDVVESRRKSGRRTPNMPKEREESAVGQSETLPSHELLPETSGENLPNSHQVTAEKEKAKRNRRKSSSVRENNVADLNSDQTQDENREQSVSSRRKSMTLTPEQRIEPVPAENVMTSSNLTSAEPGGLQSDQGIDITDGATNKVKEGNSVENLQNRSVKKNHSNRMSIEDFAVSPVVHRVFKGGKNAKRTKSSSMATVAEEDDSNDPQNPASVTSVAGSTGKGKGVKQGRGRSKSESVAQKDAKTSTKSSKSKRKDVRVGEELVGTKSIGDPQRESTPEAGRRQNMSLPGVGQKKSSSVPANTRIANKRRAKSCSSLTKSPKCLPLYSPLLEPIKESEDTRSLPSIVTTSLHFSEQDIIQSIVEKLGGFRLVEKVDHTTTHVICGKKRRTLNILHAITSGCWILSPEWVYKSLDFNGWIEEEPYQQTEFFPVCEVTRLKKFVEGPKYKLNIFKDIGLVYVGDGCSPPADALISLIKTCGGKVTTSIRSAEVVVGQSRKSLPSVSEQWILDSITSLKCQPFDEYLLNASDVSVNGANNSKEW